MINIILLNQNLFTYQQVIDIADLELNAAVIADPEGYHDILYSLSIDLQSAYRARASIDHYLQQAEPPYNRLCRFADMGRFANQMQSIEGCKP